MSRPWTRRASKLDDLYYTWRGESTNAYKCESLSVESPASDIDINSSAESVLSEAAIRRYPSRRRALHTNRRAEKDIVSGNSASKADIDATIGEESDIEPAYEKDFDYTEGISSGHESNSPTPNPRHRLSTPAQAATGPHGRKYANKHRARPLRSDAHNGKRKRSDHSSNASANETEHLDRPCTPKPAGKTPRLAPKTVYTPQRAGNEDDLDYVAEAVTPGSHCNAPSAAILPVTPSHDHTTSAAHNFQVIETPDSGTLRQPTYQELLNRFEVSKTPKKSPVTPFQTPSSVSKMLMGAYPIQGRKQDALGDPDDEFDLA